ncbi:helix-turn-helix domain-containing protein [Sphingomonas sp. KR3-1]|uniref:helix-turn-helix domain-containing protein n=1 Tax=Sphingomonas sp. KR3-1 TaxID=3156611 RepID=UPI0032B32A5D
MTSPRPHQPYGGADTYPDHPESHRRPTIAPITVRIADAVTMLGIGRSRIYELMQSGDIETIKLGRSTLIPVDSLHAMIERLRREQSGG